MMSSIKNAMETQQVFAEHEARNTWPSCWLAEWGFYQD